jgi:uncharacterized RDD family membrane protein YckC
MSSQMPQMNAPDQRDRWRHGGDDPGASATIDVEPFLGYGGFWIRVVAWTIDLVIVSIAAGILGVLTGVVFTGVIWVLLRWLYDAGMMASTHRATLGKLAVGLKVTDYAGRRLGFARATGRHFARYLSLVLLGIGFLMVALTDKKRGLHDMLAGTLVLKSGGAPAGPIASTGP